MPASLSLAFIDPVDWVYDPDTPYRQPLGGSQSALCYLTAALVERGHRVILLKRRQTAAVIRGVLCCDLDDPPADLPGDLDAAVVLNATAPHLIEPLRPRLKPGAPAVLWTQLDHQREPTQPLHNPAIRDMFQRFALVSNWQSQCFQAAFGIDRARIGILRNAISPAFAGLFGDGPILPHKPWPPVFCYVSAPFRGLDRLLVAFPLLRKVLSGCRLRVFSGTAAYQVNADKDPFHHLYAEAASQVDVEYCGQVSQTELARALAGATALAYPNTFAETSCIAVMEAMAAGCTVITSDLGALRETCGGFGTLVPPFGLARQHVARFVDATIETMIERLSDTAATEARLRQQVDWANRELTWSRRAAEWEAWLGA